MLPSDHLADLQRQRALVAAHLAWLDREINLAARTSSPDPTSPLCPPPAEAPAVASAAPTYQADPAAVSRATRQGCLLYLLLALALAAAALTTLYFVRYRDRPVLFMSTEAPAPLPDPSAGRK